MEMHIFNYLSSFQQNNKASALHLNNLIQYFFLFFPNVYNPVHNISNHSLQKKHLKKNTVVWSSIPYEDQCHRECCFNSPVFIRIMSHWNKFRVPISSFPQCWAAVKSCRQVVTLQWMDSNAKHLTYNPPNSAKVALANALTTCANEEEPGTPIKASTSNCIWEISPGPRGRDISWSSIVDLITSDGLAAKEKLRFKDEHFPFSLCAAWEREKVFHFLLWWAICFFALFWLPTWRRRCLSPSWVTRSI